VSGGCCSGALDSPALQIRCFGQFEVLRDGVLVARWRRDRARRLLRHLVVQRRPVARNAVLGLLWEDLEPTVAAPHLRVVLHALRQAIGTWQGAEKLDYVLAIGDQLCLHPRAPVWIDTDVFLDHIEAAEAFEREDHREPAAEAYSRAEALYRGDFLIDDLHDQWIVLRREELKDRYQVVLSRLADHCVELGDLMGCITHCHKLLSQDLCREDAYQRLMYCHAALGHRSRAMHWYRMCENALTSELRIGPGERTRQLYERVASDAEPLPSISWLLGDRRRLPVTGLS
jgi:DNA-binding SARP family transcriptional activator